MSLPPVAHSGAGESPIRPCERPLPYLYSFDTVLAICLFCAFVIAPQAFAQGAPGAAPPDVSAGVQLLRSGQAAQAIEVFNAIVKGNSRSADALTWRGLAENQMQRYTAAAADFRTALRVDPTMLAAHYNLALSLIRLHETDPAIEQLRIVVKAQPASVQPLYNLAVLLESKGSFTEAITHLDAAHTLAPDDSGVTLHLLTDSLKIDDSTRLSALVGGLGADSVSPETQRQAGTVLLEAGRFPDALALLAKARERDPQAPGIDTLLARALIGNGRNAEAISLLEGNAAGATNEESVYLLGLAYTGAGQPQQAAENFRTAAKLDPQDPRPLHHLGLIASAKPGGAGEAVKLLRSATLLEPANPIYAEALAGVLLATDQAEEAKDVLAKLPTTNGIDAQRQTLMGAALAATHQVVQAIPMLERAVRENPALALAHNILGFCLYQQGEYSQAASAYGKASELEPTRLLYAEDAARAFGRANNGGEATHFAQRATSLGGSTAADHALLGKLYAAGGRRVDAVQELRRAADLDPDLDAPAYLLARTYMQMGDSVQAAAWSDKLAALKQRHEADFALQKKSGAAPIRSSNLLQGGMMSAEDVGSH